MGEEAPNRRGMSDWLSMECPEHLILGTSAGQMRPDAELRQRSVEVEALPTDDAVCRYGEFDPRRTAATLHLAC